MFKRSFTVCLALVLLGFTINFAGCGVKEREDDGRLRIVTSTTMLTDLAEIIGGERAEVNGLMAAGVDPHSYRASAGAMMLLYDADMVVYNGLHLEGRMVETFEALRELGKNVVQISDGLETSRLRPLGDGQNYDMHIWFSVVLWKQAAGYLTQRLCEADGKNADYYKSRLDIYLPKLDALDRKIRTAIGEIPRERRCLVTAHDAFQYFGLEYDIEVRGLQGLSTETEAGTGDLISLADDIALRQIRAIFTESSVPPKTIEALEAAVFARGFRVRRGEPLYSDSLGDASTGCDSYIETMGANLKAICLALK